MNLPIACRLTDSELQERRRNVLQKVRHVVTDVKELEEGFLYRFPSDSGLICDLSELIELEHKCCPFLKFVITVEPGDGPVWLEMTGPKGTKEFLTEVFN